MQKRTTANGSIVIYPWKNSVKDMPNGKAVRVAELVEDYFRSPRYQALTNASKQHYQSAIRAMERVILANNKNLFESYVHKVDYSMVDYLHAVLAHTHKAATIKFYFAVLSNMWQGGLRNGKTFMNPWLRNEIKVDNERDTTWTKEELEKAIETALEFGYKALALYLRIAYETGQRPWSDLRDLKWENIKEGEDGNLICDFVIRKTGVHLILPISPSMSDVIRSLPRAGAYVFGDHKGRRLTPSALANQFLKTKTASGIRRELQMRDIRRTAAVECIEAGATRDELRSVFGWKSDATVPRYARLRFTTAKNGLQKRWNNDDKAGKGIPQ